MHKPETAQLNAQLDIDNCIIGGSCTILADVIEQGWIGGIGSEGRGPNGLFASCS